MTRRFNTIAVTLVLITVISTTVKAQLISENFPKLILVSPKQRIITKFQKVEFGLAISKQVDALVEKYFKTGEGINPYDPDQINVETHLIHHETKDTNIVYGFYYREYKRDQENDGWRETKIATNWRVRFTPDKLGRWDVQVKITGPKIINVLETNYTFQCFDSSRRGYLKRGNQGNISDRYLRFDSGEPFFGIGETIGWGIYERRVPESFDLMQKWINEFHDAGGNYVRLWALPGAFELERVKLGDYDAHQINAWELDRIFDLVTQKDIFVQFTLFIDEWFSNDHWIKEMRWDENPYKRELNLNEFIDFFSNKEAIRYAKNRMRYFASRWGYSPQLVVYEYMSEPEDEVSYDENEKYRQIYLDWVKEIDSYVKEELSDMGDHLSSVSFKQSGGNHREEAWKYWDIDVPSFNQYGQAKYVNYLDRFSLATNTQKLNPNKPYIFGEMGASSTPTLDFCNDVSFHNGIWSVSMMGVFASTPYWWWDSAIHKKGFQKELTGLKTFFNAEELHNYQLTVRKWHNKLLLNNADLEVFYMVDKKKGKVLGWAHNTDYWWPNYYHENECIKTAIDEKTGVHVDKNDTHDYSRNLKIEKLRTPKPLVGKKIVINGLKPADIVTVNWYNTRGKGGEIKELQVERVRVSPFGKIRISFPQSEKYSNGDYAFKIEKKQ